MKMHRGRCVICGRGTRVIHEIVPKSIRPKTWDTLDNRVPLCTVHHLKVHETGTHNWEEKLRNRKKKVEDAYANRQ